MKHKGFTIKIGLRRQYNINVTISIELPKKKRTDRKRRKMKLKKKEVKRVDEYNFILKNVLS